MQSVTIGCNILKSQTYDICEQIFGKIAQVINFEWTIVFVQLFHAFLIFGRSHDLEYTVRHHQFFVHACHDCTVLLRKIKLKMVCYELLDTLTQSALKSCLNALAMVMLSGSA